MEKIHKGRKQEAYTNSCKITKKKLTDSIRNGYTIATTKGRDNSPLVNKATLHYIGISSIFFL